MQWRILACLIVFLTHLWPCVSVSVKLRHCFSTGHVIHIRSRHFLSQKQEHPFVCRKWLLLPAHSQHFMLTLLQKYLYHQSQYLKTWDSKCLSLIYQMVGAFGINMKVGGSSPPQVETFSVSKTFTITSVCASKTNVVDRAQLTWQMLSLVEKI